MEPYTGPIEVGMTFVWEPLLPHATEHIKVVEVRDNGEELWFACQAWEPTSKLSGDYTGEVHWIDDGRFREAVMRVHSERLSRESECLCLLQLHASCPDPARCNCPRHSDLN